MNNSRRSLLRRPVIITIILFTLGVYSYPALETWAKTGSTAAPPILSQDTGFYLFLSELKTPNQGSILNPYYGIEVPADATAHLRFRLAFRLFGALNRLFSEHLWLALFIWNLFWWGLLCWVAVWLFEQFLPDPSTVMIALGFSLLMWFNFGLLKPLIVAWIHLPSLRGFENIGLAYSRPFFPQLPIPLLIGYLGLQMSALCEPRFRTWAGMGLLQIVAFAIFPYTTLMMAGITLVALIWLIVTRPQSAPWRTVVSYAAACAAVDILYLRLGAFTRESATRASAFRIDLAELPHLLGGMWLIVGILTLVTALLRNLPPEVKWPLVGLGLGNLSLLLGDVFFSETTLMMSHHAGYFVHATVAMLLAFIFSAVSVNLRATAGYTWLAWGAITILCSVNALLVAQVTYRTFLPLNQQETETIGLLRSIPVRADDLLVVHARDVDDACEWVPLVSAARVLFCRNAASLLAPEQNHTLQRSRQALYLYFTGMDSAELKQIMDDPKAIDEQMRLAYFGGLLPFRKEDRQEGLNEIRMELIPFLENTERGDSRLRDMLRQFPRILVIDNRLHPVFSRQRLESYLSIQSEADNRDLTAIYCAPK